MNYAKQFEQPHQGQVCTFYFCSLFGMVRLISSFGELSPILSRKLLLLPVVLESFESQALLVQSPLTVASPELFVVLLAVEKRRSLCVHTIAVSTYVLLPMANTYTPLCLLCRRSVARGNNICWERAYCSLASSS